jgi:hypothetical protein
MSLHLGNDFIITTKQTVCILKLNKDLADLNFQELLPGPGRDKCRKIGPGPFRSAVLCEKGTVYLSPIEACTLVKRLKQSAALVK